MDTFYTDDEDFDPIGPKVKGMLGDALHKLRRLSQRVAIKMARAMDPNERAGRLDPAELDAANVFRKMAKSEKSELLISPISDKRYVKNDERQVLLILDNYEITLINHVFSYTIRISQKTAKQLVDTFNTETEKRRLEMESEFKNNVRHSLQTIISSLND